MTLEEILVLDAKRTDGAWVSGNDNYNNDDWWVGINSDNMMPNYIHFGVDEKNDPYDAAFIAAAPTMVELLKQQSARIKSLEALIDEEIEFERQELKEIRADRGDMSSYGAGYSTGVIEGLSKIKEALSGVSA